MTKLASICSVLLCAVLALPASAQREEARARAAYNSGDYTSAMKEWRQLAERGYLAAARASRDQKDFADRRDEVAGKMPPAQIAEAQELARKWKPRIKP